MCKIDIMRKIKNTDLMTQENLTSKKPREDLT